VFDALFVSTEDDSPLGRIVKRNRLLQSFGNLTLLTRPLNSSVSNGPYPQKRAAIGEHSLLVLNREVCKYATWDEEKILTRGKSLFSVAKTIWPLPVGPTHGVAGAH